MGRARHTSPAEQIVFLEERVRRLEAQIGNLELGMSRKIETINKLKAAITDLEGRMEHGI